MKANAEPADFRSGPRKDRAARDVLRLGLALLWLVDALLQVQPAMFTRAGLIGAVWSPAVSGQPGPLAALMAWAIGVAAPHLVAFNWAIAVTQLALGLSLLAGGPFARAGAAASVAFCVVVWVFAQGLGQLLTGQATILSGAPGSVAVYAVAAVLWLLRDSERWRRLPSAAAGGVLLVCAGIQIAPAFWTPLGLAAPFGQAFMMPQPAVLRDAVSAASGAASWAPVAVNALLVAALALTGGTLAFRRRSRSAAAAAWAALALLAVIWVTGQDAGMLWSGMATDPNTAPAVGLLVIAAMAAEGRRGASALVAAPAAPVDAREPAPSAA